MGDTSQLPGGTGLVKTLYLQCVESLMKNRIELETSAHVSAIEQTFDLQIFYFVMKIVKVSFNRTLNVFNPGFDGNPGCQITTVFCQSKNEKHSKLLGFRAERNCSNRHRA